MIIFAAFGPSPHLIRLCCSISTTTFTFTCEQMKRMDDKNKCSLPHRFSFSFSSFCLLFVYVYVLVLLSLPPFVSLFFLLSKFLSRISIFSLQSPPSQPTNIVHCPRVICARTLSPRPSSFRIWGGRVLSVRLSSLSPADRFCLCFSRPLLRPPVLSRTVRAASRFSS